MMRVRRQAAIGEVDATAIEELAVRRDGDEHCRVAVLADADGGGSRGLRSDHVSLSTGAGYQDVTGAAAIPDNTALRTSAMVARPPRAWPPHSNRVAAGVQWKSAISQVWAPPPRS